jgi:DNA modification methylase
VKIVVKKINDLVFDSKNARTHSKTNLDAIKGSLNKFGQQKPIVIDKSNVVIAGNGTLEAAKSLGWESISTIETGLDDINKKAFALADNRTSELADWDDEILDFQLKELLDQDFDINDIGFDDSDLKDKPVESSEKDDKVPELEENIYNVQLGDIWQLGKHRLMCGDSTEKEQVDRLMDGEKADMVFTDPPYGISIVGGGKTFGKVGGRKIIESSTYKFIKGDESIQTALKAIDLIKEKDIPVQIIWGGNYYAHALEQVSSWLVWNKEMTGDFGDGELAWTNTKKPLKIFKHTWNGLIKESEQKEKRVHPTQKPIALAEWCFKEYSPDGKSVLDLFLGSGSTLIACEKTNRRCFGMEIDPHYCFVIIKRYEDFTGEKASKL